MSISFPFDNKILFKNFNNRKFSLANSPLSRRLTFITKKTENIIYKLRKKNGNSNKWQKENSKITKKTLEGQDYKNE